VSPLVDSHCHLDFPDFDADRDAVLRRARDAGVGVMQTIATRLTTFDRVLEIARRHDGIFCSVGVHPHNVTAEPPVTLDGLLARAEDPMVVGVGETGLDYHYEHSPRADQQASFRVHIRAARESGLALIVHSREADADSARILAEESEKGAFPGLIHCFSTGRQLAESALNLGFYISISGIVTFKRADALRAIVRDLPLDRLLVETDAPYLAPVPHRGKRNEPAYVARTAAAVAEIKGLSVDAVAEATTANFLRLFPKVARQLRTCA